MKKHCEWTLYPGRCAKVDIEWVGLLKTIELPSVFENRWLTSSSEQELFDYPLCRMSHVETGPISSFDEGTKFFYLHDAVWKIRCLDENSTVHFITVSIVSRMQGNDLSLFWHYWVSNSMLATIESYNCWAPERSRLVQMNPFHWIKSMGHIAMTDSLDGSSATFFDCLLE